MKDLISSLVKNAINMELKDTVVTNIGASKIGGKPHLPANFNWPYYNEVKLPLSFIAQINLEEIKKYDLDNKLPSKGMLYFFYELDTMTWGFDPKDKGSAKVIYLDVEKDSLVETEFPYDLQKMFIVPEKSLEFTSAINLPSFEEYGEIDTEMDWDEYEEVIQEFEIDNDTEFKLLGYADVIQNSMLEECEMVSRGIDCGGIVDLSFEMKKDINEKSQDWILLGQFGTIADEIMFGDCGCIYFYIRKQDLENLNFEDVHLCLQCF